MGAPMDAESRPARDERWMRKALSLARKGRGRVSPNPMVGAVLIRGDEIISMGYHRRYGGPHAEVEALSRTEGALGDCTLYVNLEPCCHHGKTPPCTELILRRGLGRVVVGALDANPRVRGKGVRILREAGVEVVTGVLERESRELNRFFFHWMVNGTPWVTLKWAQSLDGRIATAAGRSRWISSTRSRKEAHRLRAEHDAVLVGVGTVIQDDPRLTVRHVRGRQPVRIVLDSRLRTPLEARVLQSTPSGTGTWLAATGSCDRRRAALLESMGARVIRCPADAHGRVELGALMRELGSAEISSVLVEGGSEVITSFLRAGMAQRVTCFIAPIFLGKGVEAVSELGVLEVRDGPRLRSPRLRRLGEDLMLDGLLGPLPEGFP